MHRISGTVLKDIRNLKKHNTYSPGVTETLKKSKSNEFFSEKILQDEIFQKQLKIRNLDEKIEAHKGEIEKNNNKLEDLTKNFESLRDQLVKQSQLTQAQQKKNKQLRDQMERTNRLLKSKAHKIQELSKKIQSVEKQNIELKNLATRYQQNAKVSAQLRKQLQTLEKSLQDFNTEKKNILKDKQKQISQIKEALAVYKAKQINDEELKKNLESKENEIYYLRNENNNLALKAQKQKEQKNKLMSSNQYIRRQLDLYAQQSKLYTTQQHRMNEEKRQNQQLREKVKSIEKCQEQLKYLESRLKNKQIEYVELKSKLEQKTESSQLNRINFEKTMKQKNNQIENLNSKIVALGKDLEIQRSQILIQSKALNQYQQIRLKVNQLQSLYNSLLPPLQCHFCNHSLVNPITVIPCGHNFCLSCKKGYTKACYICNDKVKIEAVYRNELLDDIANVVKNIKDLINLIK